MEGGPGSAGANSQSCSSYRVNVFENPMKLKQPARIITTAWGKSYLDELLSVALPALIAPGNLPALAQLFECEFVLVTETAFFESVRNASIFQQIEKICKARLVS